MSQIFDFRVRFSGQVGNTALCLKIHHKNELHLHLEAPIFTKHSQTVCLVNTHILIYWNARCDCMLWNAYWFSYFFLVFSYIIDDHSCLNCCISVYFLHQTFTDCISNQYWYVKMPDVTASYGTLLDFITYSGIFIHFWLSFMSEVCVIFFI